MVVWVVMVWSGSVGGDGVRSGSVGGDGVEW